MTDSTTISGPFGAERFPVPGLPETSGSPVKGVPQDGPRVPLNDTTEQAQPAINEARAAREARAIRPDSSVLEGVGAAISQWDTTRLVRRLARPSFDDDTPINANEYLQEVPMVLSSDERDYFVETAVGTKSAQYAIDQIKDRRMAAQVVGDHPVAGLMAGFADPLWLVVPPAMRIGKATGIAGRAVSAASGAALGGAVTASGEGPVADSEIALSMLMNGAAAAVFYRDGKLARVDADFPADKLNSIVKDVQEAATAVSPTTVAVKPRYRLVSEAQYEEIDVPGTPAVYDVQPVRSPEIDSAKPRYGYQGRQFDVAFDNTLERAAYILAGRGKSAAHDRILDWAKTVSGLSEEQLVARGTAIRDDLKAQAKTSQGGTLTPTTEPLPYKPRVERVLKTPEVPASKQRRKTAEAVYEEIPPELAPNTPATPAEQVTAVDKMVSKQAKERGWGAKLQWNIHKTMSGFGEQGRKIADTIFDNNSDLSITSMESHREAILSELRTPQIEYENLMRRAMAEQGAGLGSMINPMTSRRAYATQAAIEREVQTELFRRETLSRNGAPLDNVGVPAHIAKMADTLDQMHKQALKEMQAAGVSGAENLLERPGYLNRKWSSLAIDQVMDRIQAKGLSKEVAHSRVVDLVALSLRRANTNGMDRKLSQQVGQAIVDRALRKGYFEDSAFNAPSSAGQLAEMRDVLKSSGMQAADIERALDVMRVSNDEAGKAALLKHRMDLDYKASMRIGDDTVTIRDLIDGRVSTIVDQYIQQVATASAFARKGLGSRSAIEKMREDLLHSLPVEQRRQAAELFDNSLAHYRGEPSGARVNENFRLIQAYGRTISLAWSGLWQMTEYATAMAQYGMGKTLKYAAQEIPGFKALIGNPTKAEARSLNNVLAEHSVASMRLRPYIARFEDGYEMDTHNALQLSAQTAGQMVPYANAMRYVHHNQAKAVGNLIMDRLEMAAKGNPKAREALREYGLESPVMDKLAKEIEQHGMNVDAWSDGVWQATRPAFAKMMDTAVLRGRLGDVPAFAAFDQVGKFIFTYRTFVLSAHNKILAGMGERNGAGAVGLLLMYQLPLAAAAVQAQSLIRGEGALSQEDLAKKAVGQMGGLGLFSEPWKWATGESNSIGAPGLIPIDRGVKLFSGLAQGDPKQASSAALTMLPVITANPFWNGMAKQIKDSK